MTHALGRWAVIDIETTGIDSLNDSIIDLGFLQFEGTTLVRKYSSLVRLEKNDGQLSYFIQKLTGITPHMLKNAPAWNKVEPELMDLVGHHLIAHNAGFEESFLSPHFSKVARPSERESYEDSLFFLPLLFPGNSSLNLESFIVSWGLADKELHRGFQDSVDLLKVLIVAVLKVKKDKEWQSSLMAMFRKYNMEDYWFYKFFLLSQDELYEIASAIEFDPKPHLTQEKKVEVEPLSETNLRFSTDFSGENIRSIFSHESKIQEIFPRYRLRQSQVDMALKAGQSFKNNVHSMIQAPTGTGKTLGYLIPSILYSLNEKKPVLIATGTKTLQNQATVKDVPQTLSLLGLAPQDFKVARLVGSGNHFCELLFREGLEKMDLFDASDDFKEKYPALFWELVFLHNSREGIEDIVIRDSLPYVLRKNFSKLDQVSREVAVDFRACTGRNCPFNETCTYTRGLREAKEASIVVGNHALMFSWPRSFPRPTHVVVDEAHRLEGEATEAFSMAIEELTLKILIRQLNHLQGLGSLFYLLARNEKEAGESSGLINQIRDQATSWMNRLDDHLKELHGLSEHYFKLRPNYTSLYMNEVPMFQSEGLNDNVAAAILRHLEGMKFVMDEMYQYLSPYRARFENTPGSNDEKQIVAWSRFESFFGQVVDMCLAFEFSLDPKHREEWACAFRFQEDSGFSVLSSPVDVGRILHDKLLETSESVVFTSATLANAQGDQGTKSMEWATGYLYLKSEKRFKSPFFLPPVYNYREKAKVFLCDDTLGITHPQFTEKTLPPVIKLIREIHGRALLLFSSKVRFETAREILLKEFEGEIPIFAQGMGHQVVEEFKKSQHGILIGMESFGEGIDVPGDALKFVFVDKIPDMREDLINKRRKDFFEKSFGNQFHDYYLAYRARSLQQKLGRLLRTENDSGGVIIVDSRIAKWKLSSQDAFHHLMKPYQIERAPLAEACRKVAEFISPHLPNS